MNISILNQDIYVNIIDDNTIEVTFVSSSQQAALQFDDEGVALGTVGTVNEVDFTGAGVTGSRTGAKVTYNIPGGSGGTVATFAEALAGTNNTAFMSPLRTRQVTRRVYNVEAYGAVHDGVILPANGNGSSGQAHLTIATLTPFTSADVGKIILISGAGSVSAPLKTTILTFVSSNEVILATNILTTISNEFVIYGTDDTAAINSAIDAAHTAGGGVVSAPRGIYIINGALITSGNNPNCQINFPSELSTTYTESQMYLIGEAAQTIPVFNSGTTNSGTVFFSTLISVSGTNPAVIGTIGTSGNFKDFNYSDIYVENIMVKVFTNNGRVAPYLSGIRFYKAAQCSGRRVSVSTEAGLYNTVSASGSGVFGLWISGIDNNGPNTWQECSVQGFEYGMIIAEHTVAFNLYAFGCNNGFVFLRMGHTVTGKILSHECINQILIPSGSTFLGATNNSGTAFIDLVLETEINTLGKWFDTSTLISDTSSFGVGPLKFNASSPTDTIALLATITNSVNLNIFPLKTMLPRQTNMAGGPTTTLTGVGASCAVFEVNSGLSSTTSDKYPVHVLSGAQSNTSTAPLGSIIWANNGSRVGLLGCYTNGATDTTIFYWYNSVAGSLQEIAHIDKNFNFSLVPVMPSFADDAAADAASQGGSAPNGSIYYRTGTSKLRGKEGGSWANLI